MVVSYTFLSLHIWVMLIIKRGSGVGSAQLLANQVTGPPTKVGEEGKSSVLVLSAIVIFSSVASFLLNSTRRSEVQITKQAD